MILVMVVEYTLAVVIAFDADENKKKCCFLMKQQLVYMRNMYFSLIEHC